MRSRSWADRTISRLERTQAIIGALQICFTADFRQIAAVRNDCDAKATAVENLVTILDFLIPWNLGDRSVKYLCEFLKFTVGLNLWYTLGKDRSASSERPPPPSLDPVVSKGRRAPRISSSCLCPRSSSSSLLPERLDRATSECRRSISVQVVLVVFHLPPSRTPMTSAVGRPTFCRYGRTAEAFFVWWCPSPSTPDALVFWFIVEDVVLPVDFQYVSVTSHLNCQQSTLIIFLCGCSESRRGQKKEWQQTIRPSFGRPNERTSKLAAFTIAYMYLVRTNAVRVLTVFCHY